MSEAVRWCVVNVVVKKRLGTGGQRTRATRNKNAKQLREHLRRTERETADGGRAATGRQATRAESHRRHAIIRRAGVPSAAPGGRGPVIPFVGRIDRAGRSTAPAAVVAVARYRPRSRGGGGGGGGGRASVSNVKRVY